MVQVRYRYRLRVNHSEATLLQAVFDTCRFVWNQALGRWQDMWQQERISLAYADAGRELTDWRSRFEWLAEQPSVPQQQVLRDLYRAIAAFHDKTNPARRPRFKSRKVGHATARWTKQAFAVSGSGRGRPGDRLQVATGAGRIGLRVVRSRPLPSPPSSVTVYRDPAGRWCASFVVRIDVPTAPLPLTGRTTGLDLGLTTFATTCDPDTDVPNPRPARGRARHLPAASEAWPANSRARPTELRDGVAGPASRPRPSPSGPTSITRQPAAWWAPTTGSAWRTWPSSS
jgi:putative transposase